MVDVGYNINGRHGVIRNVMPLANTKTEHLCFTQVDGDEQYAIKKENIEYVIPHEEEYAEVHDEAAENYIKNVLNKPITFAEKFEEVFGFEPNKDNFSLCDMMNCNYCRDYCQGCPCDNNDWDDPYVKAEVENEDR